MNNLDIHNNDLVLFVNDATECTWRELQPGDFFYDMNANWYGLKLSDHRYFNFMCNKVFGVNSDFFDVPIFFKAHCEQQLVWREFE